MLTDKKTGSTSLMLLLFHPEFAAIGNSLTFSSIKFYQLGSRRLFVYFSDVFIICLLTELVRFHGVRVN